MLKEKGDKLIKANKVRQIREDKRARRQSKAASTRLRKYGKKTYKSKYGWEC